MEKADIEKTQNGEAIIFTKAKYYLSIIAVILSIIFNLGAVFYWGGQLKAEFKAHIENKDIHNTSKQAEQELRNSLKDYMRSNLIDEKFNNLKGDVEEIKADIKEIKRLLQNIK